jgi:hypothetical protein
LEECDEDQINDREIYWIKIYNSVKDGYNIRPGGGGFTENQRKNLSIANTGQVCSPEQREKISKSWIKRRLVGVSDETKKRMSLSKLDRKLQLHVVEKNIL